MTTGMNVEFDFLEYPVQEQVLNLIESLKIDRLTKDKLITILHMPPAVAGPVPPFSGTPQQLFRTIVDTNKEKGKKLDSIKEKKEKLDSIKINMY
jgi:hypothetical protein